MSDVDMYEAAMSSGAAQESPFASDSSSSSEAVEEISLAMRLQTLAALEQQIASFLNSALQALDALNPAINPGDGSVAARREHFRLHSETYLDTLESTSAELKRSIRALEEEEIIDVPTQYVQKSGNQGNMNAIEMFLNHHGLKDIRAN